MGRVTKLAVKGTKTLNPTKAIMKTFNAAYINAVANANTKKPGHTYNKSAAQALRQFKGNTK